MLHRLANPTRHRHRQAMTCLELVAVLVLLAGILGTLTLVNRTLRHEAAETRTRHTLITLQAALRSYAADHDAMPPGRAADALAHLHAHPDAAEHLARLPLHRSDDTFRVLDGFGRPLRYQAPDDTRRLPASFVSAGLSGDFGPDTPHPGPRNTPGQRDLPRQRDFSRDAPAPRDAPTPHRRAAADNLYGFELETHRP